MRISDWSSDVCSSDLHPSLQQRPIDARYSDEAGHGHVTWRAKFQISRQACHTAMGWLVRPKKQRRRRKMTGDESREASGSAVGQTARLDDFQRERKRLVRLAYRMLGSFSEAEDVVQDAWFRWEKVDGGIDAPAAYLD